MSLASATALNETKSHRDSIGAFLREIEELDERVSVLTQELVEEDVGEISQALDSGQTERPLRALLAVYAETLPFPAWIKNDAGVVIWSNLKYRELYGDNVAASDEEFWDEEDKKHGAASGSAASYKDADRRVLNGETVMAVEKAGPSSILVVKWPLLLNNKRAICSCGVKVFDL